MKNRLLISSNTFNDSPSSASYNYTFNPVEKITELYERLLKTEQEKNAWLEKLLKAYCDKADLDGGRATA